MTTTMKEIKGKESQIRQRLHNRFHRQLKRDWDQRQDAKEDLWTLQLWCGLRLLNKLYRNQQHLAHYLLVLEDPLLIVEICIQENWHY